MFEIEDIDIMTIANPGRGPKGVARSPFGKALYALEVGQSFFVPDSFGKGQPYFSGMTGGSGRKLGRKFSYRRVEGGYRIGRVA